MNPRRISRCLAIVFAIWAIVGASAASAQDTLARAKDFYASAAYEEALQVLQHMSNPPAADADEVAAYQVFCLVALGRTDQARQAIVSLVHIDPMYHPSEAQASPRVRTLFDETRRPLLPEIARQSYGKAKAAFDHKDMPAAKSEFDRAIALLDELASDDPGAADLRTLAAGFRDLCKATPPPAPDPPPAPPVVLQPPPPTPDPATAQPAGGAQPTATKADGDTVYGPDQADVKPPVTVSRELPKWRPANAIEARQTLMGAVEVVVTEDGNVQSASILKSVLPRYDPLLLQAAASWKFRPATKDGVPVKYRFAVSVQLVR